MGFLRSSAESDATNSTSSSNSSPNNSATTSWVSQISSLFGVTARNTQITGNTSPIKKSFANNTSKKFGFDAIILIDVIYCVCADIQENSSASDADKNCAAQMLELAVSFHPENAKKANDVEKITHPEKVLDQVLHSIIGEKLNHETVNIESSIMLRNNLMDALFNNYFKFPQHLDKIKNNSSKSHVILLEALNNYYDSITKSYSAYLVGADYSAIQQALHLLKRAILIDETKELETLLHFQRLAESCPTIRYELADKIFALIKEQLAAEDQGYQPIKVKFLTTIQHYYANRGRLTNHDGIFRALNIIDALLPLNETELTKALISIQATTAGSQLLAGSTVLREQLKKLICELVGLDLDDKNVGIHMNRFMDEYINQGEKIEAAQNHALIKCLSAAFERAASAPHLSSPAAMRY